MNCIQPTPDDPAFEFADMLHIDPATCVDCGACVTACPVDAIKPHRALVEDERAFEAINAAYHATHRPRPLLAPVRPALVVRDQGESLRVAIVGSGPAAMYAAEEVLTVPGAQVTVLERLPAPYGLVRSGVAPDHRRTRRISRLLDRIAGHPGLTLRLGVEVGRDVTREELLETHHAVIYAVGAAADKRLDVPGADRPHVLTARELVGWYTGHPEHADRHVDLSHRRAVIVGNGNVALDIARLLTVDPDTLDGSDIAPYALETLRASRIEEVVVTARRGLEHAAFTLPELVGLATAQGVALTVDQRELAGATGPKADLLREVGEPAPRRRRVVLRFGLTPRCIGTDTVDFGPAGTFEAGLVVPSIGYHGLPVDGLPFDESAGVVPNHDGRVDGLARTYVVGWIKRGPTGFIGTNRGCAQDTVAALVEDFSSQRLRQRSALG